MCVFSDTRMTFCSCDLDLDPMTLIYELDLHILKMYLCTKSHVSRLKLPKVGQGVKYRTQAWKRTASDLSGLMPNYIITSHC